MDIICDTNIWYGLGNGTIPHPEGNANFILHWLSAAEILASNKIRTNPEYLRNTINFIFSVRRKIYQCPPLDHVISYFHPDHTCDGWDMSEKLKVLHAVLNNIAHAQSDELDASKKEDYVQLRKRLVKQVNGNSRNAKKLVRDKVKFRKIDNTKEIKDFIANEFISYAGPELFKEEQFDWKKIELYLETMKTVSKELVTGATVIVDNDLTDLFQLMYVQPGDKFWTDDGKLIGFIQKAGMQHYLYP